jgi:flagellar hook assembly protein FlgD
MEKTENVTLRIYSSRGQLIKTLADRNVDAGLYTMQWNGRDETGRLVSPGVYMLVLQTSSVKNTVPILRINR